MDYGFVRSFFFALSWIKMYSKQDFTQNVLKMFQQVTHMYRWNFWLIKSTLKLQIKALQRHISSHKIAMSIKYSYFQHKNTTTTTIWTFTHSSAKNILNNQSYIHWHLKYISCTEHSWEVLVSHYFTGNLIKK